MCWLRTSPDDDNAATTIDLLQTKSDISDLALHLQHSDNPTCGLCTCLFILNVRVHIQKFRSVYARNRGKRLERARKDFSRKRDVRISTHDNVRFTNKR